MGVMDKFLNYMKLNEDDDDYEDDDYYYDEDEVAPPPKTTPRREPVYEEEEKTVVRKPAAKVTPLRPAVSSRKNVGAGMEVCVIKPTSVETDGREITETLLANRTVVLNLEGLDVDVAQRIIDFTSGSCYAIAGNLQKISHYIFIVTPASVDISGDFQDILNGGSFEAPMGGNY